MQKIVIKKASQGRRAGDISFTPTSVNFTLNLRRDPEMVIPMVETLKQYVSDLGFLVFDLRENRSHHNFNPKTRLSRYYATRKAWMKKKKKIKRR